MPKSNLSDANRKKYPFSEVVSIDAWHQKLDEQCAIVDLHADVVFGTAAVGGEDQSPVRFRLSVNRAVVVIVIPENEPLDVDKSSVSRDHPSAEVKRTRTTETTMKIGATMKAAAAYSKAVPSASIEAEARGEAGIVDQDKVELVENVAPMSVMQSKSAEGYYQWAIETVTLPHLMGKPWDPMERPRLKLIDLRKRPLRNKIDPCVIVEVRCRREDLIISDIKLKNKTLMKKLLNTPGYQNKMAAAESYIRDELMKEGLSVGNMQELFSRLTLASVQASS